MVETVAKDEAPEAYVSSALVVSPFLDDSTFPIKRVTGRAIGLQGKLRALMALARPDRSLIFDTLTNTLITVRRSDHTFLKTLAGAPFEAAVASPERTARINRLKDAGLVLREDDAFRAHTYDHVSIEVNSHCNYRCSFCPVSTDPLPKQIMPLDLFQLVLDRLVEVGVRSISLNHYGEPSLDPHLVRRAQRAKDAGIKIVLFTNASRLDDERLRELAALGNVSLVVNLPTVDAESFREITGWKLLDRVLDTLSLAKSLEMTVQISVNTPRASLTRKERYAIRRHVQKRTGIRAMLNFVVTRAGAMTDERYAPPVSHQGRLNGCYRMLTRICVGIDGTVFLCCHDFNKDYVLGDLRRSSLKDIAESDRAQQLRRWTFGADTPPDGFICQRCEETRSANPDSDSLTLGDHAWPGNFRGAVGTRSALGD
ncbi:MAG: radical SAM/SPASM domain-containing protein [Alphaproteobacteria bacterium]